MKNNKSSAIGRAWAGWKRVARIIGNFQARVILSVLYVVLIAPLGLVVRLVSDPLHLRHKTPSQSSSDTYWLPRLKPNDTPDEARRQF
ncbi:MAG: hypothetical protein JO316_06650 [Abitibacteriaceae bacterium]|nr:hypothetical protein [Abditibacteriaceae bacterium]